MAKLHLKVIGIGVVRMHLCDLSAAVKDRSSGIAASDRDNACTVSTASKD